MNIEYAREGKERFVPELPRSHGVSPDKKSFENDDIENLNVELMQ